MPAVLYAYCGDPTDNLVAAVDVAGQTLTATIPLESGANPGILLATPDGSKIYVIDYNLEVILVLSPATNTVIGTITPTSPFISLTGMALSPDAATLYVTNVDNTTGEILVVDVATDTITSTISLGASTFPYAGVAISPDGTTAYIPNVEGPTDPVLVLDIGSATVTHTIATSGRFTSGVTISPDGSTVYVLQYNSGFTHDQIVVIDTATHAVTTTTVSSVGAGNIFQIGASLDGTKVFGVVNDALGTGIRVLSTATNLITTTIRVTDPANDFGERFVLSPDGLTLYLACTDFSTGFGQIYEIDTATNTVITSFELGAGTSFWNGGIALASLSITFESLSESAATADTLSVAAPALEVALPEQALTDDALALAPVAVRGPVYARTLVRGTALGAPRRPPPLPVPGPSGLHDYAVIVCDKYGVAIGQINSAVPTQVDWTLNGVGQALIDFWILDPSVGIGTTQRVVGGPNTDALLPISSLPGGREIQIWRDGQLIWWGVPTSATFDAKQVHLTCQGLLWYVNGLSFGPVTTNYAANPDFEEDPGSGPNGPQFVPGWQLSSGYGTVADLVVGTPGQGFEVLSGGASARIVSYVSSDAIYAEQTLPPIAGGSIGLAVEVSAWLYIAGPFTPSPGSLGIQITGADVNGSNSITPSTPVNQWTRIVCDAFINPGSTRSLTIQLQSVAGIIFWDRVNVSIQESVGSPPTGADVQFIMQQIIDYVNDPTRGKSDHAMPFAGPPTGKTLVRDYQFFDNAPILDALNEFPTIGVTDFEVTWDATGHYRSFEIFPPAKGEYKYNYPMEIDPTRVTDLQGSVDGTQVATAVRWLGQGSTGSSEDMGYAAFPSALGGRVDAGGGSAGMGSSTVTSGSLNFTGADIGQPIYCQNTGVLAIGTVITGIISSTQCTISKPAVLSGGGLTLGIGGLILDSVQSALPDQLPGTLQASADNYLKRFLQAQFLPTARQRADGPRGLFGAVVTGDVVPARMNYGWLAWGPAMARVNNVTLYPVTEEVEFQLVPIPIDQAAYS